MNNIPKDWRWGDKNFGERATFFDCFPFVWYYYYTLKNHEPFICPEKQKFWVETESLDQLSEISLYPSIYPATARISIMFFSSKLSRKYFSTSLSSSPDSFYAYAILLPVIKEVIVNSWDLIESCIESFMVNIE